MLAEKYVRDGLKNMLIPKGEYKPFPTIEDREIWESLPLQLKKALIEEGEKYLNFEYPLIPAARFMDFKRDGNRSRHAKLYFARRIALGKLVAAECVEDKGRFLDDIINGVWCICEESSWVVNAHNDRYVDRKRRILPDISEQIIDLFAAETGALVTLTHYLLESRLSSVSNLIPERIKYEVKHRILDPYLERDHFNWLGFKDKRVNNWNPWCNSNCLLAALFMEEDEDRRLNAVSKAMRSLDIFLEGYHPDGGCDEGTSYWRQAGGSLFDCLELLHSASNGKINVYGDSLIKEIGRYIYRAHISGDYFVNFADGAARVEIPAELLYRYGERIEDAKLMALGAYVFNELQDRLLDLHWYPMHRQLYVIKNYEKLEKDRRKAPFIREAWLNGIEMMTTREEEGSDSGFFLAAKGGHNAESHNHNDVGQYVVYYDGQPVIIDVGVENYTAKTFSPQRYEIWTMQSAYHNLPTVNGVMQAPGIEFKAGDARYYSDQTRTELKLNIAPAYPETAEIDFWKRTVSLARVAKSYIEITEDFQLKKETKDILITTMTACEPEIQQQGRIILKTKDMKKVSMEYDSDSLDAYIESIKIEDERLLPVWGDRLYRILFKVKTPVQAGKLVFRMRHWDASLASSCNPV